MIAVSAGHNPDAQGACDGDFCEFPEASIWTALIVNFLHHFGEEAMFVPTGSLGSKVRWINANKAALAVEIHFNADAKRVGHGCETLYFPGSVLGIKLAKLVHKEYAIKMGPDRGVKAGWHRMEIGGTPDYFLRMTRCPSIIVEPAFIHDRQIIIEDRLAACALIAVGLVKAAKAL